MVHSAYDSFQLVSGCPTKILTIQSYGSKLLLGCSDGSLRIYGPEGPVAERSLQKERYVPERMVKGFSKRPMVSMEVLHSRGLLLSLSDSIAFHRLPHLDTLAVISKARGANVYSWDHRRGFLCFSRNKRLSIFRHDGGRGFVEVKEFGVPDVVKSMTWCGDNICLGIRREYVILNAITGVLSQVFPSGRIAPPSVVSLPSGELLLAKDNIGVLVDQNGKLIQEGRICWSDAPAAVVIQKPYALALLSKHLEIRSLRVPYPWIQTIVLHNVRHLIQSNNVVVVAGDSSVYGLFPVPLGAQIVQLTASGNFEEALALCKLLPPEESSLRASKEGSILIRYAHHLFENESYEESMEQFLLSQVDITHVLSLYPSIVLPRTTVIDDSGKTIDQLDALPLSRTSSGVSDDMEFSASPSHLEPDEIATLQSKKMSHNMLMALIKFLQKKRFSIIEKATAEVTEEAVLDAVGDKFASFEPSRFKKSNKGPGNIAISSGARDMAAILDTALLQALLITGQSFASTDLLKGLNYCDLKICEEVLQKGNHCTALLELYKSNSMHHEALKLLTKLVAESKSDQLQAELTQKFKPEAIIEYLKPLCGSDPMLVLEYSMLVLESCPTETIQLFLSGNISADLVNSYLKQHAPNMQGTYLEHILAMNENEISGNLQNEMLQIYLSEVVDWHADLSAQQKWDEKAYSSTRRKLVTALESISEYNPEALLKRLPEDALYEERAILSGKMNQHELALSLYVHKLHVPDQALAYCDRVYESSVHQLSAKASGSIYLVLLQIYLNPHRTTKSFEKRITNVVSSQKASIPRIGSAPSFKGKGGRGAKKIAAIEGAADMRVSMSSTDIARSDGEGEADESSDEGGSTVMLDEVLDVLRQRWDRINGAQAIKLLPRETKLQRLLPYLGPLLRKSNEARRNLAIIRSLRQSESLQVKDELYHQRKPVVKIASDSLCSLCKKKIGTTVFAVYPNGKTLVHFVCFRDSQNIKNGSKARR